MEIDWTETGPHHTQALRTHSVHSRLLVIYETM